MPENEGVQVRARAAWLGVLASVLVAFGAAGCADRSDHVVVDTPTYVPMSLPGGFGEHQLDYVERDDGYVLTAQAHDTTYTVEVTTHANGEIALDPARLATFHRRTEAQTDGNTGWHDQVGTVRISASGPPGHTAQGVDWITRRMAIVPKSALDELVAASRDDTRREVELDPIEFPGAHVLIPHRTYGRLGRASFNVTTGKVTNGWSACIGCEHPENVWSWREGRVLHTLVLAPPATVVVPDEGVQVERRYDPVNGADAILLSTERTNHPRFVIGTPHQRLHRWTMQESIL